MRIYHPYYLWEDYQAGLYKLPSILLNEPKLIQEAINLLSDQSIFYQIGLTVVIQWKYAAEINLTNPSRNHQAWIGQASCCYACGVPEYLTKQAWHCLSVETQIEANRTADRIKGYWKTQCRNMD